MTLWMVKDWQVSDYPSISDHAFLRFNVSVRLEIDRFLRNDNKVNWGLFRQELSGRQSNGDIVEN